MLLVYGPGEVEGVQVKDQFFEQLSETIENITRKLIIVGD